MPKKADSSDVSGPIATNLGNGKLSYPATDSWSVVKRTVIRYIRGPLLAALLTTALFPYSRQLRRWWGEVGFGGDRGFFVFVGVTLHELVYLIVNWFFLLCDRHSWFADYKIQRLPSQVPTNKFVLKTVMEGLAGHLTTGPITYWYVYLLFVAFGMPKDMLSAPCPDLFTLWKQFAMAVACNEVGFYFAHRTLHRPYWYGRIHKQHHEFTGTIGFAAEYAHPLEQVFANHLPTAFGCLVMGVDPLTWFVWLAWRLEQTYEAHSGYSFQGTWLDRIGMLHADDAIHHDFHHSKNMGNYGSEFLDHFFGTMDVFDAMYEAKKKENNKKE